MDSKYKNLLTKSVEHKKQVAMIEISRWKVTIEKLFFELERLEYCPEKFSKYDVEILRYKFDDTHVDLMEDYFSIMAQELLRENNPGFRELSDFCNVNRLGDFESPNLDICEVIENYKGGNIKVEEFIQSCLLPISRTNQRLEALVVQKELSESGKVISFSKYSKM